MTPPPPTAPPVVPPSPPPRLTNDLAAQLANAAPGATIRIPPGNYPGGLVANRAVHLVGTKGQVFIDGAGRESLAVRAAGVTAQDVQFSNSGTGELPAVSVYEGADLQLQSCQVQSNSAVALSAAGQAVVKARDSSFTARNGTALRLTKAARGDFAQVSFNDSGIGLWLAQGARAELHSCAFLRDGGNGGGAIIVLNNPGTTLLADDCQFANNHGGINAAAASLTITNSTFSQNGLESPNNNPPPLIALRNKSTGTVSNSLFEANLQGINVRDGSHLEMEKCQFTNTGSRRLREVIPTCEPVSLSDPGTTGKIRDTAFSNSAQYALVVMAGAKIELEEVDISGTRSAGLVVGDRSAGAGTAEIKSCRFRNNSTGLGVFAGSSATARDAKFWDNQDGIIVLDELSQLQGENLSVMRNRDAGLFVHAQGEATVSGSQFQNNARDAIAGVKGKEEQRGALTLTDCRFSGSRFFALGACVGSEVRLTNCNFEGTKKRIFQEKGAQIRTDAEESPAPSAEPSASPESSPAADEEASPNESPAPADSATPTPAHRPHHRPTPRPHPPTPEDIRRSLRKLLPGG